MNRLRARDVMSRPVITVRPQTPVVEVARLLTGHRVSGVPVVDDDGKVLGIVSEADLLPKEAGAGGTPLLHAGPDERGRTGETAADVMTPYVLKADEDTPLRQIAAVMARNSINRIPIVREGRPVGIVTRNDVLKAFARTDHELECDVREVLRNDLLIDPDRLVINVAEGVVTIEGLVDRKGDVSLVQTFVGEIDGVVQIDVSRLTYRVAS